MLKTPFNNCNIDFVICSGTGERHIALAMGTTDDGRYIATRLYVCPWALLTVLANTILVWNRLLHSLNGIVGSDGHNWILGISLFFLEPTTFTALQYSCKPFTNTLCYNLRQREAAILHPLPVVSGRGSFNYFKVIFLVEIYFCGNELMKKTELLSMPNYELSQMSALKRSVRWFSGSNGSWCCKITLPYIYIYMIKVLVKNNKSISVANPIPEVKSSGTVPCRTVYPSAKPDLPIRIRQWFISLRKTF
jgi:hypothetical protein